MPNKKATTRWPAKSTRKATGTEFSARKAAPAERKGTMTVREAGRKGGLIGGKKGGDTVKAERGREFYQEIGRKGGQKVRELIAAGKAAGEPRRRVRRSDRSY